MTNFQFYFICSLLAWIGELQIAAWFLIVVAIISIYFKK